MTSIDKYISELLFDHDCVILPGFGGFLTNYSGARIHPIRHSFQPPARTVVFNANLRTNDGLIIDFVARQEKISYQEASSRVGEYAETNMKKLESGEKLVMEHIGSFSMGREKNIIFDPDLSSNYLDDAFGLTSFVSPAIKRETVRQRLEKQLTPRPVAPREKQKRNLMPAMGWAAGIAIPIAAAVLLYMFNPTIVQDLSKSYATFVPTVKFSTTELNNTPNPNTTAEFSGFRVIPEKPVVEPEPEPEPVPEAAPVSTVTKYQIVVGAFSVEANANNYVQELKGKNYNAMVIGTNRKGLTRVSINGSDSKAEAITMMEQIREAINPSAWLLRIR